MQQQKIKRLPFVLLSTVLSCLLLLYVSTACSKSRVSSVKPLTHTKPKEKKERKKKERVKKLLQVKSRKSTAMHVEIVLTPPKLEKALKHYTIISRPIEGSGALLAPASRVGKKFEYTIPLTEEKSIEELCLNRGSEIIFYKGEPIGIRCKYQPSVGSKQGDSHQIRIIVRERDENHAIIQEESVEVTFLIPQDIQAEDLAKQDSAKKDKKSRRK